MTSESFSMDATAIERDAAALRSQINLHGFVVLRQVLERQAVDALGERVWQVLEHLGWVTAPEPDRVRRLIPPARGQYFSPHSQEVAQGEFIEATRHVQSIEELHALTFQPRLRSIIEQIAGGRARALPMKLVRMVWPDAMSEAVYRGQLIHQDYPAFQVPDMLTVWVPLVECPSELGGLRLLEGSNNLGIMDVCGIADDDGRWRTTAYSPGDVVIFHCLTAHSARPNRTDRLRLSIDFRWHAEGTSVPEDTLHPHLFPFVPDWPVLSAGWKSREWIDASGARLHTRVSWEELRHPPSALCETVRDAVAPPRPPWWLEK